jgi:uncharacterized protein (DUF3084 family)
MSEVNYSESVIIPTLQKKVQDLQNSNLVLEVNLLVEQARHRDVAALYSEVKNSLKTSSDQLDVEVNRATSFANDLRREISVKESILGEYRNLKETYDALMAENNTLKTEIEQLKTPVVDTKKKTKTLITQVQV